MTVTSKRHAQAERAKRYAVTVFSQSAQVHVQYGDAPPREAESEGGSAPEPRLMETPQLLPIELSSRTLKGEHTDRARKEGRTGRSGTR